jgi:hypothetical protein
MPDSHTCIRTTPLNFLVLINFLKGLAGVIPFELQGHSPLVFKQFVSEQPPVKIFLIGHFDPFL